MEDDAAVTFEDGDQNSNGSTSCAILPEAVPFSSSFNDIGESSNEDRPGVQIREQGSKGTAVPEFVVQINDSETQKRRLISRSGWSTLRVPAHVFILDKRAYSPKIVSIGPFHHNEPSLTPMEAQKRRFLDRLRTRIRQPDLEESLKNAMKELQEKTREWYSEDFEAIKPDDFVHIMVFDGCFIVELLRLYESKDMEEPIFETRWTLPNVARDLLLLENQLPMFVLQKIFELTTFEKEASPLNKIALRFFEPLRPGKDKLEIPTVNMYTVDEYPHLLALFHSTLTSRHNKYQPLPSEKKDFKQYDKLPGKGWIHNAKTLSYAGIEFRNNSGNALDIEFKHKKLKIPTIFIDNGTGPLLRNLIAYEQSNRHAAPYFCCLAVFLDSIVDTVDDVKILRDAGIIKQAKGGNEEVANLFNSLTKELEFDIDDCYITKQIEDINRLCRAHETKVRFRRLLSRLNFKGLLTTYASITLTVILSLLASYVSNNGSQSNGSPSLAPPPQ